MSLGPSKLESILRWNRVVNLHNHPPRPKSAFSDSTFLRRLIIPQSLKNRLARTAARRILYKFRRADQYRLQPCGAFKIREGAAVFMLYRQRPEPLPALLLCGERFAYACVNAVWCELFSRRVHFPCRLQCSLCSLSGIVLLLIEALRHKGQTRHMKRQDMSALRIISLRIISFLQVIHRLDVV